MFHHHSVLDHSRLSTSKGVDCVTESRQGLYLTVSVDLLSLVVEVPIVHGMPTGTKIPMLCGTEIPEVPMTVETAEVAEVVPVAHAEYTERVPTIPVKATEVVTPVTSCTEGAVITGT